MSESNVPSIEKSEKRKMTLRNAFFLYLGLILMMYLLITLTAYIKEISGFIVLIAYLIAGFILNRQVLRKLVQWHSHYDTLANVSKAKLFMFLLWPIGYLILFIQFGINAFL